MPNAEGMISSRVIHNKAAHTIVFLSSYHRGGSYHYVQLLWKLFASEKNQTDLFCNFEEQICQNAQKLYIKIDILCMCLHKCKLNF